MMRRQDIALREKRRANGYNCWHQMLRRCFDPKSSAYRKYGARGVTVCDRWRTSFEVFIADVGPRPTPRHSIDRIDSTGDYEPGNVRWATPREQILNSRTPRWFTHKGKRMHHADWARRLGLTPSAIAHRLRRGWSERNAMTLPKGSPRPS